MTMQSGRADRNFAAVLSIGLGLWLFLDILRVWLPSLITVFGQAAQTPAWAMGLFALGWFLSPLPVLALRAMAARTGSGRTPAAGSFGGLPLDTGLAVLLGAVRLAVQAVDGGPLQLYVASAGVFTGLAWLAAVVTRTRHSLLSGFALGIALSTAAHAAFGSYAAVWWPGAGGWVFAAAQTGLFWWTLARARRGAFADERAADPALCFLLLPAVLIAGTLTASPARAEAAAGWPDGVAGAAVAVAAAVAFTLSGTGRTPGRHPAVAGVSLVVAVAVAAFAATTADGIPGVLPFYAVIAQAVGAVSLIACLAWADRPGGARGQGDRAGGASLAVLGGGALFVSVLFVYYAGYDLGYRADAVLVATAGLITATAAVRGRRGAGSPEPAATRALVYRWPGAVIATAAAALASLALPVAALAQSAQAAPPERAELRVLAYNLRMGYGMTGAFEAHGVVEAIRAADVDVVLLSEVDRGWMLNGGQDGMGALARSLGMRAVFAPAADQVWGDAVLTRLPVVESVGHPLDSYGAPIGAQALSVVVEHGGTEVEVVSTHLQPPPGGEPVSQAADVADIVAERVGLGRPVVVGGDFNFTPGSAAWNEMERVGLYDALAMVRPRPSYPADLPKEELDHIFVSDGLVVERAAVLPVVHSDHLPVLAQVVLE